ncbi:hypothetical protein PPERSA_05479 [Pseudocohnilembus persalinus]|uniref:Uncharacterized protein n=1 Tax=Pseudocohnilembus persalinus TaxID=266149 RepID=A0A0V0R855_PSEPJ|nr:hypothetical protein PPERSA_05479 [Pseudocohnilembus persalinus]|eukprot:KRX10659.1 hypothetical protein PPERSA_05479 [Pseudocohnilembus persalinus]
MDDDIFNIMGIDNKKPSSVDRNRNSNIYSSSNNEFFGTNSFSQQNYNPSHFGQTQNDNNYRQTNFSKTDTNFRKESTYRGSQKDRELERQAEEEIRKLQQELGGTDENDYEFDKNDKYSSQKKEILYSQDEFYNEDQNSNYNREQQKQFDPMRAADDVLDFLNDKPRSTQSYSNQRNLAQSQEPARPARNRGQNQNLDVYKSSFQTYGNRDNTPSPTNNKNSENFENQDAIPEINIGRSSRRKNTAARNQQDKQSQDSRRPQTQQGGGSQFDKTSLYGSERGNNDFMQNQDSIDQGSEIETFTPTISRRRSSKTLRQKQEQQQQQQNQGRQNISGVNRKPPIDTGNSNLFKAQGNEMIQSTTEVLFKKQENQELTENAKKEIEEQKKRNEELTEKIKNLEKQLDEVRNQQTKLLKEKEEEFEKQIQQLKKAHSESTDILKRNHIEELKHEKLQREEAMKEMYETIKNEKERIRQVYQEEMNMKDEMHQNEKKLIKKNLEYETQNLKDQIKQQMQMNTLSEELRMNSDKLNKITYQLQNDGGSYQDRNNLLEEKQYRLKVWEQKLESEQVFIDQEKKRLENLKLEVQNSQLNLQKDLEKERRILQNEYQRIQQLQDTVKSQEVNQQREILVERYQMENERKLIEEEKIRIQQEKLQNVKDVEKTNHILEEKRKNLIQQNQVIEQKFQQQLQQLDKLRAATTTKEIQAEKALKLYQRKLQEINQLELHNENQFALLAAEQKKIHLEKMDLQKKELQLIDEQEKLKNNQKLNINYDPDEMLQQIQQQQEQIKFQEAQLKGQEKQLQKDQENLKIEKKDIERQKQLNLHAQMVNNKQYMEKAQQINLGYSNKSLNNNHFNYQFSNSYSKFNSQSNQNNNNTISNQNQGPVSGFNAFGSTQKPKNQNQNYFNNQPIPQYISQLNKNNQQTQIQTQQNIHNSNFTKGKYNQNKVLNNSQNINKTQTPILDDYLHNDQKVAINQIEKGGPFNYKQYMNDIKKFTPDQRFNYHQNEREALQL